VVQAVPMLYRLLIDAAREDGHTFPTVKHVLTTGDKMPATSLKELPRLFPNARFFNIYGCTETNDSLMQELHPADGEIPANIPVGQPLPGVTALMEDGDGGFVEGEGTGELVVWTPFQTQGYLKAALNEGKFSSYPDDEKRYFRTGDIVRRHADGFAHVGGAQRLLREGPRRSGEHTGRRARPSRSTRTSSRSPWSRYRTSWREADCMRSSAASSTAS